MKVLFSDGTCLSPFHWDQLLMILITAETSTQSEILSLPNQLGCSRSSCFSLIEIIRITDNGILRSIVEEMIRKVLCNPALHLGNVALQKSHGGHLLRGSFAVNWHQTLPTEETIWLKKKKRTPSLGRKEQSTKNILHVKWHPVFSLYKCSSCSYDWHPKWECQNCQYTETIHYLCAILLQLEVVNYPQLTGHPLSSLWV